MATEPAAASQPHVPAWKRLGLKLKYAKDTAEPANGLPKPPTPSEPSMDAGSSKKRGREEDASPAVEKRSMKKSRKSHEASRDSSGDKAKLDVPPPSSTATSKQIEVNRNYGFGANSKSAVASNKHTTFNDSDKEDASKSKSASPDKDANSPKRRKSVSFTSDTKQDDGFSGQNAFKQWAAQQKGTDGAAPSVEPTTSSSVTAKSNEEKQKAPKTGEAKAPTKAKPKSKAEPGGTPRYITYLETFANHKDNWKFSKATQNDVLKNVWNLYRIPAAHNPALFSYISGLQGNAARQRLIEGARAVLQEVEEKVKPTMETDEARKAAYEAARQRDWDLMTATGAQDGEVHQQQLDEIKNEAERGRRAERILGDLLAQELGYPRPGPPPSMAPAAAAATTAVTAAASEPGESKKRKRKARTEVSSSSESDSSSSSDSDSSSSDSDSGASDEEKPAKKKPIFDADFLSKAFPKTPQPAPKSATKKAPGGKKVASSSSSSDSDNESDSSDSGSSSSSGDSSSKS